ncbi:unnamed protein product [Bursaphelenchus xylophilus]|uniref:(pine wood nematode) hypothetical protein n=1 Tax=Bursaphelenchus xylophilus TaxID=6326 RepID=A0A7I8WL36_BURXY|nr:unnamed protein product [Bursaphelenchus xylophilus]CAG9105844.1 unnamed protein product [Bursaphelenchus xylophilus]
MRKRGLGGLVVGAVVFLIFLGYRIDYKYDTFSQLVVRSDPLKEIKEGCGCQGENINEIQSWCNVEYRKFDYANYPPHFRNLLSYAFKIVIAEILRTERNFFFYDSSVRLDDNLHKMIPKAIKEGKILPFMNFNAAWHSVYATLANGTLDYIPLPNEVLYAREYQSILFISDSAYTRRFIRWFSLCALTEDCISPKGAIVNCTLHGDPLHDKMNCHRYDQNLWNMIHLEFLFHPIERGAISLGLIDKWGNGTEFIRNVLRERDSRYLWWGSKFLVVRAGSQTPIKVECAEQANSSTTAVLKEILL